MAMVLKYTYMSKENPVFHDIEFIGKVEYLSADEQVKKLNFRIIHFGGIGESGPCTVYAQNIRIGEFNDVTLVDVGEGRYDLELGNGYLLYHIIPEE